MKHQKTRMIIIRFWDPSMLFSLILSQETNGTQMRTPIYLQVQALFPSTWHLQIEVQFLRFALCRIAAPKQVPSDQSCWFCPSRFTHNVPIIRVSTQKPYQRTHLSCHVHKKRAPFLLLLHSSSSSQLESGVIRVK